ncbi:hypothetical protein EDD21DRAFT_413722 [Dissophora ornata]|nr:hypothetical protein EDD21DRAFT_413722 [Dissophora ornata]
MLITGGAIMVIRKRNRRRRSNSVNIRQNSSPNNGSVSVSSIHTPSKKSVLGTWDQKTMTRLENGPNNGPKGANAVVSPGKGELRNTVLAGADDIPPVSGYNSWEQRGSVASHRRDDIETTTTKMTMTPMLGITQTTIVTTPKNSAKSTKVPPMSKTTYSTNTGRQMSEQDPERPSMSHTMTNFTRADAHGNQTQDSWSESHQQYANQHNLEQEFEEKSQGAYFPISVERQYY